MGLTSRISLLLATGLAASLAAPAAQAGEKPLFAPIPAWVAPAPPLAAKDVPHSDTVIPEFDEQVFIDGDRVNAYFETVSYISSAEELNKAGTLTLGWQPQHGDLTVHRVEILRGEQVIDALKPDPGFTVLRREAGLEQQIVDGSLTAVKHIEGLRVGDVLRLAFTTSMSDSVLAGHVQSQLFLLPRPARIQFGRARLVWPSAQHITWKAMMPGIAATPKALPDGRSELVVPFPVPSLPDMPKALPARFQPLPMLIATSFDSWSQVASVMAPLYRTEGAVAEGSDLARAIDAIGQRESDPVRRIAAALQMVQNDVRYQLIALGTGNYTPQQPADTWQKRFGDCKAKTLLLIAALRRLGIEAEPVLANSKTGDLVPELPPAALAFDHVFVHARTGGEDFWLDGTALGDRLEDIRDVPRFGHVLPLREKDAGLVRLPVRANARAQVDVDLAIDNSTGPHLPAPFTLTVRYSGGWAEGQRIDDDSENAEKLVDFAEKTAKTWADSDIVGKPVATYDPVAATWTMKVDGVAFPDWNFSDGRYELAIEPSIKVDFSPDRSRSAWRQMSALIDRPWTAHARKALVLPGGGAGVELTGTEPGRLALPAVAWERTVARTGGSLVEDIVSRESGAEVPAAEVSATARTVEEAMGKTVQVRLPAAYPQRWDDVARQRGTMAMARVRAVFDQRIAAKPDDVTRIGHRAWLAERLLDFAGAEADYTRALAVDPSAQLYLARSGNRAKRGDHAGALKDAQAAYDLESGNKEARTTLAYKLANVGKVDDALDLVEANPDPATEDGQSALLQRVEVMERGGRHDDALALLDSALGKRPSVPGLRNARCWFRALRGSDLDAALEDCNRAIELASNPAAYLDSRAMVHFRAGRLKEALADYDGALAIAPDLAESHFMRALVKARLGDARAASEDMAAARKLYPDVAGYLARYGIKP